MKLVELDLSRSCSKSKTDARAKRYIRETFLGRGVGGGVDFHRNTERLAIMPCSPLNIAIYTNNLPDVVTLGEAYIGHSISNRSTE